MVRDAQTSQAAGLTPVRVDRCRSAWVRQRVVRTFWRGVRCPRVDAVVRREAVRSITSDLSSSGLTAPTCRPAVGRGSGGYGAGMPAIAKMRAVVLDCPDPRVLAEFYRALVGGDITYADDDWVNLRDGGNVLLSFQRAPNYQAPDWPSAEHGQQFHIDVTVDDVDQADQQVLAIGARRTELQPGIDEDSNWRVYLDPVGHPFCLCWD
jgi:Glyoxalase-like domain